MKKRLVRGIVAVTMLSALLCTATVLAEDFTETAQQVVETARNTPRHPGKIESGRKSASNHVGKGTPRHPGKIETKGRYAINHVGRGTPRHPGSIERII